jgi:hypothetical protein
MNKSRRVRQTGSMDGEKIIVCRILVGKPEGKKPLGRPRSRWMDNIKLALKGIG